MLVELNLRQLELLEEAIDAHAWEYKKSGYLGEYEICTEIRNYLRTKIYDER